MIQEKTYACLLFVLYYNKETVIIKVQTIKANYRKYVNNKGR